MNKQYDQHVILKSLDNPLRILFWDLSDFTMLALPFFLGMLLENFMIFWGGIGLRILLKRILRRLPKGRLKSLVYWYFPTQILNRTLKTCLPPSHIRKFLH